jgi:hypothetical protein
MTEEQKAIIDKVFNEFMAMPREEFIKMIEEHENGWVGQMLEETGAINLIMEDMAKRK